MKRMGACLFSAAILMAASVSYGQGGTTTSSSSTVAAPSSVGTVPSLSSGRSNFPGGSDPVMGGMSDMMNRRMSEQMEKNRNTERQRRIETDTARLVHLVDELKTQVGADKEISPAELGKRAEEIEKLAKSVKDRMKG